MRWILAFFITMGASAWATPPGTSPFIADIVAKRHGALTFKAKGTLSFQQASDQSWSLKLQAKGGPVKVLEETTFRLIDGNLKPINYQQDIRALFFKEQIDWSFDWNASKLSGRVNGDPYSYTLVNGMNSPNSFQVAMRQDIAQGAKKVDYPFMKFKRPSHIYFAVIGEERLSLGDTKVDTIIIEQTAPLRSKERKLIWIAPGYDYIPVKFETKREGKLKESLEVTRLTLRGRLIEF